MLTLTFTREATTKRTVRFHENDGPDPTAVGCLYVQKTALAKLGDPETLTVVIATPAELADS